jgi:hypothetical protein
MQKKTTGSGGGGGRLQAPVIRHNEAAKIVGNSRIDVFSFEVGGERGIADPEGALRLGQLRSFRLSDAPRLQRQQRAMQQARGSGLL